MDINTKFEQMQKVLNELEGLKINQTAVIKKIGEIETQSITLADTQLEMKLDDLYESFAMNIEKVETAFSFYQQKLDEFAVANHLQVDVMQ